MMAKLLKDGDSRLELVADFEVQSISAKDVILDIEWHNNSTFHKVFDELNKKHRKGLEISVLDYGDDLQATVTAIANSVKYHYLILMD